MSVYIFGEHIHDVALALTVLKLSIDVANFCSDPILGEEVQPRYLHLTQPVAFALDLWELRHTLLSVPKDQIGHPVVPVFVIHAVISEQFA